MKTLGFDIETVISERLGGREFGKSTAGYKFGMIKAAKEAAKAKNPDLQLIDMGIGEPDSMAANEVVDALYAEAQKIENRVYADNGCREFSDAVAEHMSSAFGVKLCSETEIVHSIGSKSALGMVAAALVNPGDLVLMTTPGYGVFGTHARYYGGDVETLELSQDNGFLPDLTKIDPQTASRAKVLVLNYPNNPTGAVATREFYEEVIEWALSNEVVVINDAAYALLTYDEADRHSILNVPGAMECALELHSLSKSHSMTGWRLGWVCGNAHLVKAYGAVKENSDSGQFLAIQKAGVEALKRPEIVNGVREVYQERMTRLFEILKKAGFDAKMPAAGFFLYVRCPEAIELDGTRHVFENAQACTEWLITQLGVVTVPWDECGRFLRFSVTCQNYILDNLSILMESRSLFSWYA